MSDISLILLCAGNSTRFELSSKKQWLRTENSPLWLFVTKRLSSFYSFNKIIIASHEDELNYMKNFTEDVTFVRGGDTRQGSMKKCTKRS